MLMRIEHGRPSPYPTGASASIDIRSIISHGRWTSATSAIGAFGIEAARRISAENGEPPPAGFPKSERGALASRDGAQATG
jgi:hypothetical protein